jgi:hypothetical protein
MYFSVWSGSALVFNGQQNPVFHLVIPLILGWRRHRSHFSLKQAEGEIH